MIGFHDIFLATYPISTRFFIYDASKLISRQPIGGGAPFNHIDIFIPPMKKV